MGVRKQVYIGKVVKVIKLKLIIGWVLVGIGWVFIGNNVNNAPTLWNSRIEASRSKILRLII